MRRPMIIEPGGVLLLLVGCVVLLGLAFVLGLHVA